MGNLQEFLRLYKPMWTFLLDAISYSSSHTGPFSQPARKEAAENHSSQLKRCLKVVSETQTH
jgi:hypothetical protein